MAATTWPTGASRAEAPESTDWRRRARTRLSLGRSLAGAAFFNRACRSRTAPWIARSHRGSGYSFTAAVNAKKPGRDPYALVLRDVIGNQLGKEHTDDYAVTQDERRAEEVADLWPGGWYTQGLSPGQGQG